MSRQGLVAAIDGDPSVREPLPDRWSGLGCTAQAFSSADAFRSPRRLDRSDCLLLDLAMPRMSGIELQREG
jgi:FixJ family two-component response regulator